TVWDGAGCVGGNKILLRDAAFTLWLDFGQNLSRFTDYYDEYLKPQKARGLYELLVMGLLPPVRGIYQDRFLQDYAFENWQTQLDRVDGVLLSHAHSDHAGDLQYLLPDIPLICSAESALLLRALQDCNSLDDGTIYVRQFEFKEGEFRKLAWNRKEQLVATYRSVLIADSDAQPMQTFWCKLPGGYHEKCDLRPLETFTGKVNGHRVRFFPIDHSIPGAGAWAVETSAGWVVYTGDLRFRGERRHLTEQFAEQAAQLQPVALIIEGTRITREGSGYTEDDVQGEFARLLQQHRGRLVCANFSMTHLERLKRFWQAARECGRQVVVNPKDLYLLHAWRESGHDLSLDDGSLRLYQGVGKPPSDSWEKALHERYGDLCITAQEIARQPGEYLLCFGYFDLNELPYLKVNDGLWIHSFSEPMTEEQRLDDQRLKRWLGRFGFTRYPLQDDSDDERIPLHVSGHASGEELEWVVQTIRPRKLIPVHTTEPEAFRERFSGICEVVIPEVGEEIRL
ncbi:MAG: MBL fold metallo-hydrolase, partial [Armatimonadota bacterium]|nr:MBL fold metallo-hydrolase [Armatimonadota bacterium]